MIFTYVYGCTVSVTLLTLFLYFFMGVAVSRARGRYNVQAPAVHGPVEFERIFRAHANTAEQLILFLPLLWISAVLVGDLFAGVVGIIWPVARLAYALGYYRNGTRRVPGFVAGTLVNVVLFAGSIFGLITYNTVTAALQ